MTLEEKLKLLEQNEAELANRGWSLIQALRRAIEQRDDCIKVICKPLGVLQKERFSDAKEAGDAELLEILEGK